jgi:predicted nucleic acid-binding Zn ribbon protein
VNVTQATETVADLIAGASPRLGELRARARAFSALADRVRAVLPSAEATHVTGIVQCGNGLVILVDSSAWCARLRYRASALRPQLSELVGHEVQELRIRVVPRGARG